MEPESSVSNIVRVAYVKPNTHYTIKKIDDTNSNRMIIIITPKLYDDSIMSEIINPVVLSYHIFDDTDSHTFVSPNVAKSELYCYIYTFKNSRVMLNDGDNIEPYDEPSLDFSNGNFFRFKLDDNGDIIPNFDRVYENCKDMLYGGVAKPTQPVSSMKEPNVGYLCGITDSDGTVCIPGKTERYTHGAFSNTKNIQTMFIPSSAVSIGKNAFCESQISNLYIPEHVDISKLNIPDTCIVHKYGGDT